MKQLLQQAANEAAIAAAGNMLTEPGKDLPVYDERQEKENIQSDIPGLENISLEKEKENKEVKNKGSAAWDRSMLFL